MAVNEPKNRPETGPQKKRERKQCGIAFVLGPDGSMDHRWCILDRWPRHKMHLLVMPDEAPKGEERLRLIEEFKRVENER